jgi:hypothetical protein
MTGAWRSAFVALVRLADQAVCALEGVAKQVAAEEWEIKPEQQTVRWDHQWVRDAGTFSNEQLDEILDCCTPPSS